MVNTFINYGQTAGVRSAAVWVYNAMASTKGT
jgi:hypothetical protein